MNTTIRTARRGLVLLIAALLAALGLLALTASHNRAAASPYPPTTSCAISTLNQTVVAGDTINLNGSGFGTQAELQRRARELVIVHLGSAPRALGVRGAA